jgi:hypothetical protein
MINGDDRSMLIVIALLAFCVALAWVGSALIR